MAYPVGQANSDINPGNVGPWTKIYMDWLTPIEITSDGTYTATNSFESEQIYKIACNFPDQEYLLVENKHAIGWDINMWKGGTTFCLVASIALRNNYF